MRESIAKKWETEKKKPQKKRKKTQKERMPARVPVTNHCVCARRARSKSLAAAGRKKNSKKVGRFEDRRFGCKTTKIVPFLATKPVSVSVGGVDWSSIRGRFFVDFVKSTKSCGRVSRKSVGCVFLSIERADGAVGRRACDSNTFLAIKLIEHRPRWRKLRLFRHATSDR